GGACLYIFRWALECHLQRSAAIFPDRGGVFSAELSRPEECGWLGGAEGGNRPELHAFLGGAGPCADQTAGGCMVWSGHGRGLCAFVWILVHGFFGGAARHGGEVHERGAADTADWCVPEDAVSVSGDLAGLDCRGASYAAGEAPRQLEH